MSRLLFVSFILVSILLIGMIWLENLDGEEQGTPGYYRDTFVVDERVYATVTAEAAAVEQPATPLPHPSAPSPTAGERSSN